jgi:hypothetical protein
LASEGRLIVAMSEEVSCLPAGIDCHAPKQSWCQHIRHTGAETVDMISDRKCPTAYSAARRLIASLVCSFAFLLLVAVAAWIVISSGAGHPTWQ